ncbi:MAG TPA: outer membrane protein assembly factor BamE [Steroidobacteraceae bacterium]|jgi:outer membrane protein assembly factor BamE|nr:outer membrane protein assembly factor BamE [Steroidobacteraceae bacterium]
MRRELPISVSRLRPLALALLAVCIGLAGCVYRMDIQQGNYLDGKAVRQLKVGMTRSQVRYLLGTPMIEDVFDKDRWDYIYYFKHGYVRRPVESRVIVYFQNDKVQRLALDNVPKGRPNGPNRMAPVSKFPIF